MQPARQPQLIHQSGLCKTDDLPSLFKQSPERPLEFKTKYQGQNTVLGDSSSGPVVKTLPFTAGGMGSIPGRRTKIPHAAECGQKFSF